MSVMTRASIVYYAFSCNILTNSDAKTVSSLITVTFTDRAEAKSSKS